MKRIAEIRDHVPQHWVGDGFPVRSLFDYQEGALFDPFLLLDYAGPHDFAPADAPRGVGQHPHRGFETVTIVYQGELEHHDSAGNHGAIAAGDVQWMTAAAGVIHEEYHSERFARDGGTLEMVQLWVNLPARHKLSPPGYQEILARQIPSVPLPGDAGSLRVIAGEFPASGDQKAAKGPASTFTRIQAWDVRLKAGRSATFTLAEGDTALVVLQRGTASINGSKPLQGVTLVRLEREGTLIKIDAQSDVTALLLSGQPIGEPIAAQGPFVMNTREEIQQAIVDYQSGKMGRVS